MLEHATKCHFWTGHFVYQLTLSLPLCHFVMLVPQKLNTCKTVTSPYIVLLQDLFLFVCYCDLTIYDNRLTCRTYDVTDHKVRCHFAFLLWMYLNTNTVVFLSWISCTVFLKFSGASYRGCQSLPTKGSSCTMNIFTFAKKDVFVVVVCLSVC